MIRPKIQARKVYFDQSPSGVGIGEVSVEGNKLIAESRASGAGQTASVNFNRDKLREVVLMK